jgi:membrane protease YdiL (CAAX protease family)
MAWRHRDALHAFHARAAAVAGAGLALGLWAGFSGPRDAGALTVVAAGLLLAVQLGTHTLVGAYSCRRLARPAFAFLGDRGDTGAIDWRRWVLAVMTVLAGGQVLSVLLFKATGPRPGETVRILQGLAPGDVALVPEMSPGLFVLLAATAVGEEIVFRLGIQSYLGWRFRLEGDRYAYAVLLTAVLWTLGHLLVLEPSWVKVVQIFPIGLGLGWLHGKYGVESSMAAHAAFNVLMAFPLRSLMG